MPFRRAAAVFLVLSALAAVPLALCDVLPLFDYPNHLARMYLLAHLATTPALLHFYTLTWQPLPNLAMDLLVPPLLGLVPLEVAGRVFVLVTFLLIAGGAAMLHRVLFGRWSAWPWLAFLLLYNRILLWGFLNYLFGVGLVLLALAAWIALRDRAAGWRLAAGVLLASAVYAAHLMAFGIYGLLVAGVELGWWRRARWPLRQAVARLVVAGLPFLPALALLLSGVSDREAQGITFTAPWRKVDLLFSVFDAYSRPFDVACFAVAVLGIGLAFARRWVRLAPPLVLPLALLFAAYIVMPSQLLTASGADRRLPVMLALLLVAGTEWAAPSPRLFHRFLGAAILLLVLRLGEIAIVWHGSDREYRTALAALDRVAPGSRIAVAYPDSAVNAVATPLVHLPTLAIARRDAFVPTLFAYPTQQPVALRPEWRALADSLSPGAVWAALVEHRPLDTAQHRALDRFDYVVLLDRRPFTVSDAAGLVPVAVTPRFQLYRLRQVP
jgi:hypothetical protein